MWMVKEETDKIIKKILDQQERLISVVEELTKRIQKLEEKVSKLRGCVYWDGE